MLSIEIFDGKIEPDKDLKTLLSDDGYDMWTRREVTRKFSQWLDATLKAHLINVPDKNNCDYQQGYTDALKGILQVTLKKGFENESD